MEPVFADFDLYLRAFWLTIQLFFWSRPWRPWCSAPSSARCASGRWR